MTMPEQLLQRADLIGTQVITRDTGRKLGVINQVWVDVDQRQVVAMGLRSTLFTGEQRFILLTNISQIGDVILIEDEDAIEPINTYNYSSLIDNEVITETGEILGKVRGFKFDPDTGDVTDLILASIGMPWIPAQLISTYELPIEEIISSGPERLIVFEGAESRLVQITVGLLERVGLGAPPWEDEEDEYLQPMTPSSNQLPSGSRNRVYPPERRAPRSQEWDEPVNYGRRDQYDEYAEEEVYEDEYEPEVIEQRPARRRPRVVQEPLTPPARANVQPTPADPEEDPWNDEEVYQNQPFKVKEKQPEEDY